MTALIKAFFLPWQLWVLFGFIIGAILFNNTFRDEFDALIGHMMGLKPKDRNKWLE